MARWKLGLCALALSTSVSAGSAQQLDPQQLKIINDTAKIINDTALSICTTVREARGQKTNTQIEGDVKAQVSGLIGKVVDVGGSGKGSLTREEFEGLTRDATAVALQGDRECRERVFNKMIDTLKAPGKQSERSAAVPPYQRRIAIGGFAIGDSFERLKASVPPVAVTKTKDGREQVSLPFQVTIPKGMDGAPADTPVQMIATLVEDRGLISTISSRAAVPGYCRNNFMVDNAMREATKDLGEPIAGAVERNPSETFRALGDVTWYDFKRDQEHVGIMWWESDEPKLSPVTCVLFRTVERAR